MPGEEVLALREVTFTYEGDVVALRDLNLSVRRGEFLVVLGANGAGKSTLCYLISGIVPHIYGGGGGGGRTPARPAPRGGAAPRPPPPADTRGWRWNHRGRLAPRLREPVRV